MVNGFEGKENVTRGELGIRPYGLEVMKSWGGTSGMWNKEEHMI